MVHCSNMSSDAELLVSIVKSQHVWSLLPDVSSSSRLLFPHCRRTWTTLRWARLLSWGPWWRLCVRQQWEVSESHTVRPSVRSPTPSTGAQSSPCSTSADDNTSCRVDTAIIQKRLPVLLKYLNSDTERQLQALYALQALIVTLDQPPSKTSSSGEAISHWHSASMHILPIKRERCSLKSRLATLSSSSFISTWFCFLSQTFSGCSSTVYTTRTSSQRTLSTSGSRAKTPPSSTARAWPSSLSRPSSPGCGRRRRSRRTIDKRAQPLRWTRRCRTASWQQNKHWKWVRDQDGVFTARTPTPPPQPPAVQFWNTPPFWVWIPTVEALNTCIIHRKYFCFKF